MRVVVDHAGFSQEGELALRSDIRDTVEVMGRLTGFEPATS
jgi:hypothetical protein